MTRTALSIPSPSLQKPPPNSFYECTFELSHLSFVEKQRVLMQKCKKIVERSSEYLTQMTTLSQLANRLFQINPPPLEKIPELPHSIQERIAHIAHEIATKMPYIQEMLDSCNAKERRIAKCQELQQLSQEAFSKNISPQEADTISHTFIQKMAPHPLCSWLTPYHNNTFPSVEDTQLFLGLLSKKIEEWEEVVRLHESNQASTTLR